MSLAIAIGIYFICWWLVFFMVLPIGNRVSNPQEAAARGLADSAPENPRLLFKAAIATAGSAILFAAVYVVIAYRLLPLEQIFGPV